MLGFLTEIHVYVHRAGQMYMANKSKGIQTNEQRYLYDYLHIKRKHTSVE